MTKFIAMLMLAAAATSAQAAGLPKELQGAWCLTQSIRNGDHGDRDNPRTNTFERIVDCPAVNTVVLGPHSLDGLQWSRAEDRLVVDGLPKPAKGKGR
jgi:hypothetical protein